MPESYHCSCLNGFEDFQAGYGKNFIKLCFNSYLKVAMISMNVAWELTLARELKKLSTSAETFPEALIVNFVTKGLQSHF